MVNNSKCNTHKVKQRNGKEFPHISEVIQKVFVGSEFWSLISCSKFSVCDNGAHDLIQYSKYSNLFSCFLALQLSKTLPLAKWFASNHLEKSLPGFLYFEHLSKQFRYAS